MLTSEANEGFKTATSVLAGCDHQTNHKNGASVRLVYLLYRKTGVFMSKRLFFTVLLLNSTPLWAANLCPAAADVLFSCPIEKSRKSVSICEIDNSVKYIFGTPAKIDITLPDGNEKEAVGLYYNLTATGESKGITFNRGEYTYLVQNLFGGKPPSESDEVVVIKNGRVLARLTCSNTQMPDGSIESIFDSLKEKGFKVVEDLFFTTNDLDHKSVSDVATREFLIVNGTNQVINKIFVSPSESDQWGRDLLGDEVLRNGYQRGYTLGERAGCINDIRVEYVGSWIEEKYKMNLCQLDRIVFNGDNAKRVEAQPHQGSASRSSVYDGSEPLRCGQNVNCSSQSDVVSKMQARWAKFSSTTHFSSACLDAIARMRSMHPAVWGDGHPGFVQPQMDVCNAR